MRTRGSESARAGRRRRLAAVAGLALGLWALSGPACGGGAPIDPTGAQVGGSGGAATSSSTTSSGATSTSGAGAGGRGNCPSAPIPEGVPEDWVEWTDWSCSCRMYIPGPDAVLPPITWAPCPDAPPGLECEALDNDWLDGLLSSTKAGQPGPGVDVDANGKATLLLYRGVPYQHTMFLVADADGPVHTAMMRPHPGAIDHHKTGCALAGQDMNEGRYLVLAQGADASASTPSEDCVAFGGAIEDARPTLLHHYEGSGLPGWRAGAKWLAWLDPTFTFRAHPWDMSAEHFITSPATDPDGYKVTQPIVSGDAVFWMAGGTLYGGGLMVWDAVNGTRSFVRWPGDLTRMAANLGTDGIDMVWSEGEGKEPGQTFAEFPIRRIMTAPFTGDPDKLDARRLRGQPGQVGEVWPWVVGCGFGAFDNQGQKLVVRLSDGWMWVVPTFPGLSRPVGVTCEHVILRATLATHSTLVRIRLDSLGDGLPPD
jgi:hypothetical protein